MGAPEVQIEYEQMSQISSQAGELEEQVRQIFQRVQGNIQNCRSDNWVGDHANQFYQRMDNEVMPGVQRLSQALGEMSNVVQQIIKIMESAEEEAQGCFTFNF